MRKLPTRVSFVIASILVVGCQAAGSPSPSLAPLPALEGTAWRAVLVGGRAPAPPTAPTLLFKPGRVEGSDGCNTFGGDGRVEGDRLVLGEVAQTLMLCAEPINGIGTTYMAAVRDARMALDAKGRLWLRGPNADVVLERFVQ